MDKAKKSEIGKQVKTVQSQNLRDQGSDIKVRRDSSVLPTELENPEVYFAIPRTVYVLYGPYMYEGIMDYRPERLQGLKTILEKLGVTVELKPCLDHVNLVRVWFLEEQVFSCKMTSLMHAGDGELDPLCYEAAAMLEKFIRQVLRGLRRARPIGPEELKRPFCPCFHQGHEASSARESTGGSDSDEKELHEESR